jgi:hypothetical protein
LDVLRLNNGIGIIGLGIFVVIVDMLLSGSLLGYPVAPSGQAEMIAKTGIRREGKSQ